MSGKGKVMADRKSGRTSGVSKVGRMRQEERQCKLSTEDKAG